MVNQKGEFPLDAKVSARVKSSTKRLLKTLKSKGHSESDVIEYAAMKLAKEPLLLEWEIGELDQQIANVESSLFELKSRRQAKLNRLKIINPEKIDNDVLNNLMVESAKDYALSIKQKMIKAYGNVDMGKLNNPSSVSSIRNTGEEWGYDPDKFLEEVKHQLKLMSDNDV